jgi:hypothetical protein
MSRSLKITGKLITIKYPLDKTQVSNFEFGTLNVINLRTRHNDGNINEYIGSKDHEYIDKLIDNIYMNANKNVKIKILVYLGRIKKYKTLEYFLSKLFNTIIDFDLELSFMKGITDNNVNNVNSIIKHPSFKMVRLERCNSTLESLVNFDIDLSEIEYLYLSEMKKYLDLNKLIMFVNKFTNLKKMKISSNTITVSNKYSYRDINFSINLEEIKLENSSSRIQLLINKLIEIKSLKKVSIFVNEDTTCDHIENFILKRPDIKFFKLCGYTQLHTMSQNILNTLANMELETIHLGYGIITLDNMIKIVETNTRIKYCTFYFDDDLSDQYEIFMDRISKLKLRGICLILCGNHYLPRIIKLLNVIKLSPHIKKLNISNICDGYTNYRNRSYKNIAKILNDFKKLEYIKINDCIFYNFVACVKKYLVNNESIRYIEAQDSSDNHDMSDFDDFFSKNPIICNIVHYADCDTELAHPDLIRNRNYKKQLLFAKTKVSTRE